MLNLEERPPLPEIPKFSRDMERALVAAAEQGWPGRPAMVTWLRSRAAAGIAVVVVAAAAGAGIGYAVTSSHPGGRAATGAPGTRCTSTPPPSLLTPAARARSPSRSCATRFTSIRPRCGTPSPRPVCPPSSRSGRVCYVPGPSAVLGQVLGPPQHRPGGDSVLTITPAAIPRGWELSIGFFHVPDGGGIHVSLVPDNGSLTCTPQPPARPHP